MACELLVVEPVFAERVWGGTTLAQWYGERVPPGVIGECWAISGLPGSSGLISAGAPPGTTLAQAWSGGLVTGAARSDDFPLLCKLLAPRDWLSVQVHPNDEQARELEGQPRGKAECWYVLQCQAGAELILGHGADDPGQLVQALEAGELLALLHKQVVAPGSFLMVPAGCIHAVGPGMLVYEVQQSSDITYRLYDFDRPGLDGRPRELHADKGFSVVTAPYDSTLSFTAQEPVQADFGSVRLLVRNGHFTVHRHDVATSLELESESYRLLTVIAGAGSIARQGGRPVAVSRSSSIVIPAGAGPVTVSGPLSFLLTDPGSEL